MYRVIATLAALALLSTTTPLMAQTMAERPGNGGAHLGLHVGTLGPGLNAGYDFSQDLALRGFVNYLDLDFDEEKAGNEYDGKLKLRSFGLVADWHPFWSAFRVSGGGFLNHNGLSASTEGVDLGIGTGKYDANLDLRMEFERFAPYLGFGWTSGRGGGRGLTFTADVGTLFRVSPQVSARGRVNDQCDFSVSEGGDAELVCSGNVGVVTERFRSDLEENLEREHRELRDDLDKLKVYPVLSLGVSYRF